MLTANKIFSFLKYVLSIGFLVCLVGVTTSDINSSAKVLLIAAMPVILNTFMFFVCEVLPASDEEYYKYAKRTTLFFGIGLVCVNLDIFTNFFNTYVGGATGWFMFCIIFLSPKSSS